MIYTMGMNRCAFLIAIVAVTLLQSCSGIPKYQDSDESDEFYGGIRRGQNIHHRFNQQRSQPVHNQRGFHQQHQGRRHSRPSNHRGFNHQHQLQTNYPRLNGVFRSPVSFSPFVNSPQIVRKFPYSIFSTFLPEETSSVDINRSQHFVLPTRRTRPKPNHRFGHGRRISSRPSSSQRPKNPFQSFRNKQHQNLGFTPAKNVLQFRPAILSQEHHQQGRFDFFTPESRERCPDSNFCSASVLCAAQFVTIRSEKLGCTISPGAAGACCPNVSPRINRRDLFGPLSIDVPIRQFSLPEINDAARYALRMLAERDAFETELQEQNIIVNNNERPAYGHLQFFKTTPLAMGIGRNGLLHRFTGESLIRRFKLTPIEAGFGLQKINAKNSIISNTCPIDPTCGKKEFFYRTLDGSCNNQKNPKWGQANTPFQRILPPQYNDGYSEPRRSVTGRNLPSARVVSLSNVPDVDRPNTEFNLFVMQWGQFIDHDLTHTPIFRFGNESGIECCNEEGQLVQQTLVHPSCFPIEIPANDPFHAKFGRRCMNFIRSTPAPEDGCSLGHLEQMNQVSHFLDGSAVYGSSTEEARELRLFQGGLLKVQDMNLLPADRMVNEDDCNLDQTSQHCFLAGDNRVNEHPDLTIIHTLWVRQHNRLARELFRLNPHWSDETIYQEARRIVAAQIQHIVYNEWLPIILGESDVENNDLLPLRDGFYGGYDHQLDPTILNEFATVAFRFGHTLVEGMLRLYGKEHQSTGTINLFEHFNSPRLVYSKGKFDELIRGLFKQPMQSFDNFVVDDLTNRLFQTEEMPFGMDLIALNIQRARDHGIPSYNDLRSACGIPRARTFEDLRDFLNPEVIAIFRRLYASVDDIDPFIGGISEVPVNGGVVGATFNCIIRDQFTRLKLGDRFFYENGGRKTSFTEAQLHEIRQTSWARIVCETSNHIKEIQPLAMRLPGPNNEKTSCTSQAIPTLDLTPWISAKY